MTVTLIEQTPNPVELIARVASICYDSDPKDPMKLVKKLWLSQHHSVFEHVYFTFLIEGISRACSHQLVRYRHCSFTQRSQRFCDEQNFEMVYPPADSETRLLFDAAADTARGGYRTLRRHDVPAEDARYVLPNACQTSLYLSCNLRELMHICNERLCQRAQWEIRDMVKAMTELIDPSIRWMLVPKCEAPYLRCCEPCGRGAK